MNAKGPHALDVLLSLAEAAEPGDRIQFRDAIAGHGTLGIDAMTLWLRDARLAGFAVRVIGVVGRAGHGPPAYAALVDARADAPTDAIGRDIDAAIAAFAPRHIRTVRSTGRFDLIDDNATLRGQPAVRYRIQTHRRSGHFNVPREVMDLLGIPTDGNVDVDVIRASTGGVVFSGRMGIASGSEIYPTADDPSAAVLRAFAPHEVIEVIVARDARA